MEVVRWTVDVLFVLDLKDVGRHDVAVAGGKGANLGELIRAGFPVPRGFIVTTAAYDRFLADNHLEEIIARGLADSSASGGTIRAAMDKGPIPAEVEHEILTKYEHLHDGAVAVRSSATAEDLPGAAFAGQQDTFLNVIGAAALLDAIRRCWASLWNDRAIAYRARLQIDPRTVKLAVVMQRMVAAEVAGVLFTANPITGARDEVVVDASPGLGEAVVSGLVTPDHHIVRKEWWGWRGVEHRPGRREVMVQARPEGGTEQVSFDAGAAQRPALTVRELRRLARLGARIERHFGCPQDIEWAFSGGQLFILQARPITALPEAHDTASPILRTMVNLISEMLPARPYPLEATTWGPGLVISALLGPLLRVVGFDVRTEQLFVEEDGVIVRFSGRLPVRPTPRLLLAPVRLLRQARRYELSRWQGDPLLAEALARARALEARDPRTISWMDLLATVREALTIAFMLGEVRVRYMPGAILGFLGLRLMLGLIGRTDCFDALLCGVETKTLEVNRALERLAARIRADPFLADAFARHEPTELWSVLEEQPHGRAFLEELGAFLDQYGHREAGGTLLVSQGTWKESPEVVLGILKGLAVSFVRGQARPPDWRAVRDDVLRHPLLGCCRCTRCF